MDWNQYFHDLFLDQGIIGVTINNVYSSPTLRSTVLTLSCIAFIVVFIVFLIKDRPFLQILRLAVVAAFFAGGFAYAVHADMGWGRWVVNDHRILAGKDTRERLTLLEGPLYEVSLLTKKTITGDYMMLNDVPENYVTRRFEYFMLPQRKRPAAQHFVVLGDRDARFDPKTGVFTRKDMTIRNVSLVSQFLTDAYILKQQ